MSQTTTDIAAVADALRAGERFLVTSHENPDGDALGSLLAMHLALVELGKDSVMVLAGAAPLPAEYAFLDLAAHGLLREAPADAAERVLVAVDCAQETRLTDDRLLDATTVVNIDHHHDNTRFGTANLVVGEASSTAEVLADVFDDLGVVLTPAIADGALRRARHRHRPLPVLEHDAEGAASGGRAGRGRRRPAADLPGRLRVDAVPEAAPARARARSRCALRGRSRGRLVPRAERLR